MKESEFLIDDPGSLRYFLALALRGECEQRSECERYPFFGGKNLELLGEVSKVCERHYHILEGMEEKLELVLEEELDLIGKFFDSDIEGKRRGEIAENLLERGELLLDLYRRLRSSTDEGLVEDLLEVDSKDNYFEVLEELISKEGEQVENLRRLVRRIEFLPSENGTSGGFHQNDLGSSSSCSTLVKVKVFFLLRKSLRYFGILNQIGILIIKL